MLTQNEKLRNELEQSVSNLPTQRVLTSQNKSNIVEEDLIVPITSTIVSTSNLLGGSSFHRTIDPIEVHSTGLPSKSSSNKWDPPLLCPLPPTFLRLTPNEVCFFKKIFFFVFIKFLFNHLFLSINRIVLISKFPMNNLQ